MSRLALVSIVSAVAVVAAAAVTGAAAAAAAATPAVRFASVTSAGELVAAQSSGAVSAARGGQGKFKVVFDTALDRCAASGVSNAGSTSASTYTYDTKVATAISGSTLYVTLMGRNDGPADFAFSVLVACKEAGVVVVKPGAGGVRPGAGAGGVKPGAGGLKPGAGAGSGSTSAAASTLRFATVTAAGSLVAAQSFGATSAARGGQGKFKVVFDSSIAGCAASAVSNAGSTSANTYTYDTKVATAISGSTLYVTLMGRNDGPADFAFSVVLACTGA